MPNQNHSNEKLDSNQSEPATSPNQDNPQTQKTQPSLELNSLKKEGIPRASLQNDSPIVDRSLNDSFINQPVDSSLIAHTSNQNQSSLFSRGPETELIQYNHVTYLLYVLSFFTAGILWIVPIVMNYASRKKANGTWLATHFDWQIKTFWYSIILWVIGWILIVMGLGVLGVGIFSDSSGIALGSTGFLVFGVMILVLTVVWHIYRIIRGWIALSDKRPIQ